MAALAEQDWQRAADALEAVVAESPERFESLYGLAVARFQLKQYAPASAMLEQVLRAVPEHGASLELLGIIESNQRQQLAAIRHLDRAETAGRKTLAVYSTRCQAHYARGNWSSAYDDAEAAAGLGSKDAMLRALQCSAAIRLKRADEARAALDAAKELGLAEKFVAQLTAELAQLP